MNLIEKTRKFLKEEKIDYLLVNSTNEFLAEYSQLEENSRYHLTNFSGSTGDALLSDKDLYLFVDGRYHEQADKEVDKKITTVVKMKLGQSFLELFASKIKPNSTLAMVAQKNSQGRFEILTAALKEINVQIRLIDFDPVLINVKTEHSNKKNEIVSIDDKISGQTCEEKLNLLSSKINSSEAFLCTNSEEVSYLCNLRDFSTNYSSKISAKAVIMKDFAVIFSDLLISNFSDKFMIKKMGELKQFVENAQIDSFYVDKKTLTAYDFGLIQHKAIYLDYSYLGEMKSIKTDAEIAHFKSAFERTDKAILETREFIENNENLSEFDVCEELEKNFYKYGAKALSFKPIVAKDKNSALAHYTKCSKDEILKDGSLILIDCGAYYEGGYATDCTRVFVKGLPSKMQKRIYTIVLKGFLKAFNKKITDKTTGYALDKSARKVLTELAPNGFDFSHALGHGIGISVHESPPNLGLNPASKKNIDKNMCFTIEPGLYKKSFGGVRLENSCYMDKINDKLVIKSFSNMPFEKKLIDFSMLSGTEKKWLNKFEVI